MAVGSYVKGKIWHHLWRFAFWHLAKGIEARRTSLQQWEFSLQGFSMKSVLSGTVHWPKCLVKLTPARAGLVPSTRFAPYGAAYLER